MLKLILGAGLIFYLLSATFLYVKQRQLLYFPAPAVQHGLNVEWLEQGDNKLEVIALNPGQPDALIYFGDNIEEASQHAAFWQALLPGLSVYLPNYRGYGASTGSPSEEALFADALALYDKLIDRHASISVIGRSLGSGVAVYLASERQLKRLALVTPYDSLTAVAQSHYPIFPAHLLVKDQYNSIGRAPALDTEILVLQAEYDNVITLSSSQTLVGALKNVQVWLAKDTDHNSVSEHAEYGTRLAQFLQR